MSNCIIGCFSDFNGSVVKEVTEFLSNLVLKMRVLYEGLYEELMLEVLVLLNLRQALI